MPMHVLAGALLCLSILSAGAAPSAAAQPPAPAAGAPGHRDNDLKYSVTLPAGWEAMSSEELKAHNDEMQRVKPGHEMRWVFGYNLGTGDNTRAYVLIANKQASMNKQEIDHLVSQLLGGGVLEKGVKEAKDALKDVSNDITLDRPSFSPDSGTLTIPMTMVLNDGTRVRGLTLGRIGTEGLVMFNFYTSEAEFATLGPQFGRIVAGITFDAGHTYADAQGRSGGGGGSGVKYGAIGGAIGAIIAVVVAGNAKKKKEQAGVTSAPAGQPPKA